MQRRTMLAFAVAGAASLAAVVVGVFAPGGSSPSPGRLLQQSAKVMAAESFSFRGACEYCDEPTVLEYAPPDRIRVTSGSPRGDNWPYYLYLDGMAYFSEEGERWITDERDGNGWLAGYQRMVDPRVLLTAVRAPELVAAEDVGGYKTHTITGGLDFEALLAAAPPGTRQIAQGPIGDVLRSVTATFWIDADDHRLRRMRLASGVEEFGEATFDFDFETPVDIPPSVQSMDAEEANRLGNVAEDGYRVLLEAIRRHHEANGRYPEELTPDALASVLPGGSWPTNPFTGEPVRNSPGTPGNFDYRLIANGEHIIFQVHGWDGSRAYYDSERFGEIPSRTR